VWISPAGHRLWDVNLASPHTSGLIPFFSRLIPVDGIAINRVAKHAFIHMLGPLPYIVFVYNHTPYMGGLDTTHQNDS
jgi:hypothetical protein